MTLIKNAVDTWVRQDAQTRSYSTGSRLQVQTASGNNRYAFLFFTRPWPTGSTIISAKLRLWQSTSLATSATLTAQRVASKWSVNRLNYGNMPTVIAGTATQTKATSPSGTMWELDVLPLLQAVADGGVWYGFRIATNSATLQKLYSTQSSPGATRPQLEVTWSMPPDQPDGLSPSNGRSVSIAKPVLRSQFRDPDGENTMISTQVQIDALGDFTTGIDFDSGEVAATYPQLDLNATAYAGIAAGAITTWRTRHKDSAGVWSPWSLPATFARTNDGVLTITNPSSGDPTIKDGSPTISWTFTGTTQRAYQVIISPSSDPNNWVWDSGKITSTLTTIAIPFGNIKDASLTYRVTVRIWDTVDREETPGDPVYVEATRDVTIAYDAAVAPVTGLNASSDPLFPIMNLTWSRSAVPTNWQIQRSDDAGATWDYVAEYTGAELSTGGTNYAAKDTTAAPYTSYQWRVLAVNATQSASNPTVSGEVRRLAPFLMRTDGTDVVLFMNPKRSKQNMDVQEVFTTLGDAPAFVVTQKLGGKAGHVEGELVDNVVSGLTAKGMSASLDRIRLDSGVPMILSVLNEQKVVVPYNINCDGVSVPSGIYYVASFDYVEV